MAGYIGSKAVLLSTTAATVTGDAEIAGGLTVDTDTLVVDSTNNRVGIGTASPPYNMYIKQGGNTYSFGLEADGDDSRLIFGELNSSWRIAATYDTAGSFMPITFWTGDAERMRIKSDGQIDLGHSTPLANLASGQAEGISFGNSTGVGTFRGIVSSSGGSAALYLAKTNAFTDNRFAGFYANSNQIGSITTNGTSTSYNTSSDYRLKEDWQPMTGASERVLALNPVNFAWKADSTRVDGFLAHEAQAVVPEAVHGVKDGMRTEEYEVTPAVYDDEGNLVSEAVMGTREVPDYQGIDQSKLVPLLTAALQEALTEIAALKDRVAALEAN